MTMSLSNWREIEELQIKQKYLDNIIKELVLKACFSYSMHNTKQCNYITISFH
jgi:hypothetical protein